MKSITIDISEKVYKKFKGLMDRLPSGSFKIYENDPDALTVKEEKQYYSIQKKIKKGDFSDFENWDDIQDQF